MSTELMTVFWLLITVSGVLSGVWIGYKAGKGDQQFIERDPDITLPEIKPENNEPSIDEVFEDIRRTTNIVGGYEFEKQT